jgi:hypothetical protein
MSKRVGFRCAVCKAPVKGEQHAANHAKATAHAEFEEYEMAADEVIPVDEKKTELTDEQRQQVGGCCIVLCCVALYCIALCCVVLC